MFLDFWCHQTMRSRIQPMKKIARTLRILELALYHSLGNLPEPELTHEFL
jgi:hypothetical protein